MAVRLETSQGWLPGLGGGGEEEGVMTPSNWGGGDEEGEGDGEEETYDPLPSGAAPIMPDVNTLSYRVPITTADTTVSQTLRFYWGNSSHQLAASRGQVSIPTRPSFFSSFIFFSPAFLRASGATTPSAPSPPTPLFFYQNAKYRDNSTPPPGHALALLFRQQTTMIRQAADREGMQTHSKSGRAVTVHKS